VTVDATAMRRAPSCQALGSRGGDLKDMQADGRGRVRLDYMIPSRGLIGFQTEFRTMTRGTGLLAPCVRSLRPGGAARIGPASERRAHRNGQGTCPGVFAVQFAGARPLCIGANEEVYEGMIIGLNNRDNDLVVNPLKGKKLTNMRAAGKDEAVVLTPPIRFSLEQAMEFIDDDELIEVTPNSIRLRKRNLRKTTASAAERETADQGS
jgi:GTP-binding protein